VIVTLFLETPKRILTSCIRFEVFTAVIMKNCVFWDIKKTRMASTGMLRRVALVITDVLEEYIASIIRVARIGELGTTLTVTYFFAACFGC
jgi:hypothetical protein